MVQLRKGVVLKYLSLIFDISYYINKRLFLNLLDFELFYIITYIWLIIQQKRKAFFRNNQLDMFDKGNPESINPDLPIDEQTELLPYDQRWEFPRERLKLGKTD